MTPPPCVDKSLILVRGYQCRSFVVFVFCSKNEKQTIYIGESALQELLVFLIFMFHICFSTIFHTFMSYSCLHANDFRVAEVSQVLRQAGVPAFPQNTCFLIDVMMHRASTFFFFFFSFQRSERFPTCNVPSVQYSFPLYCAFKMAFF